MASASKTTGQAPSERTVAVIGAKHDTGFGRHYVRILAELAQAYNIGVLVVTRTSLDEAQRTADAFRGLYSQFKEVYGDNVKDTQDLDLMLATYQPDTIFITSKGSQPETMFHHHLDYTELALSQGVRVLCEKPLYTPSAEAPELKVRVSTVSRVPKSGRLTELMDKCDNQQDKNPESRGYLESSMFGIELPLFQLAEAVYRDRALGKQFEEANEISFRMSSTGTGDVLPDLGPHALSMLPYGWSLIHIKTDDYGETAAISCKVGDDINRPSQTKPCTIILGRGSRFRGFRFGNNSYAICIDRDNTNYVISMGNMDLAEADRKYPNGIQMPLPEGFSLCPDVSVSNPLRQHIEGILNGKPIASIGAAVVNQVNLDMCMGYGGSEYKRHKMVKAEVAKQ